MIAKIRAFILCFVLASASLLQAGGAVMAQETGGVSLEAQERHAAAIEIGLRDLELHLKQDPELAGMSDKDYSDYAVELMETFLAGQEAWVIEDLVRYAPAFSDYVVQFPGDFPFAEGVGVVIAHGEIAEILAETAEARAEITETEARIAELRAINAALEELISTLQQHSE